MLRAVQGPSLQSSWTRRPRTRIGWSSFPQRLESGWVGRTSQAKLQHRPPLAFAFDIDGVLIHGERVLPQAENAFKMLHGQNKLGIKIPYILMTNGGGVSETARCKSLSEKLGVEISLSQFMQSHTILKSVVEKYADKPVLVLGGKPGAVPGVAAEYGFRKAYTPLEILAWNPSIWPFHDLTEAERAFVNSRPPFDPATQFAAIFVFHDPRNWGLDIQIACDILRSGGSVLPASAQSTTPTSTKNKTDVVDLVFCNPDLLWGSDFPAPRFGQGAFRAALQSVHTALAGVEYPCTQYGKPTEATYRFAERILRERIRELRQLQGMTIAADNGKIEEDYLPNVYMVGDNPESDIAGANAAKWSSVLVETGVYNPSHGPPLHMPTHFAQHVEQAVHWAIEREAAKIQ